MEYAWIFHNSLVLQEIMNLDIADFRVYYIRNL